MGKAVPKGIKSKAMLLMKEYPEKFTSDFEKNKSVISELEIPLSKTNRNLVVGFTARKIKQHEIKEKAKAEAAKKFEKQEKPETKAEKTEDKK